MSLRTALKIGLSLVALGLAVVVAAVAWFRLAPRHVPPGQPPLATLDAGSLPAFRDAFNAADDEVRVLALLSPT